MYTLHVKTSWLERSLTSGIIMNQKGLWSGVFLLKTCTEFAGLFYWFIWPHTTIKWVKKYGCLNKQKNLKL